MLENTFLHLPGIGETREEAFWKSGVLCWGDYLKRFGKSALPNGHVPLLEESVDEAKRKNHSYFSSKLLPRYHHRAYRHFRKEAAYVDIETTGLGSTNEITVIGIWDPGKKETNQYINGINLERFGKDIKKYKFLVTFNGSLFDIPFIERELEVPLCDRMHTDLRFVLSSLGIRGGLKNIEKQFGIERGGETEGLTGWDAVKLWKRYTSEGDEGALDLLLKYNGEDICNMEMLMEYVVGQSRKKLEKIKS